MSLSKSALIAAVAAIFTEVMVWWLFCDLGNIDDDGPNGTQAVGLALHFPGLMILNHLHLTDYQSSLFLVSTGCVQFFFVFLMIFTIYRRNQMN